MKKSLGAHTHATPAPVWVVGTYDETGKANAMVASWAGICCSQPPCLSIALRKATHTYSAIVQRKAFTINLPSEKYKEATDHFGTASGRKTDKFKDTGLTPTKSDLVDAPYIEEFPVILECKLVHSHVLGLHTIFVGEIVNVRADEEVLNKDGIPDFTKVNTFLFDPISYNYYHAADIFP